MSNNEKYVCVNCVEHELWITKKDAEMTEKDAEIERLRKELKLVYPMTKHKLPRSR